MSRTLINPWDAKILAIDSHVAEIPFTLLSWMCPYVAPAKNTDHMSTGASKYESRFQIARVDINPPPKRRKLTHKKIG
jgi:hypothetical protein